MTNLPPHPICPGCSGPVVFRETSFAFTDRVWHRRCAPACLVEAKTGVPPSATVNGIELDGRL
jgi:hypothetical protein